MWKQFVINCLSLACNVLRDINFLLPLRKVNIQTISKTVMLKFLNYFNPQREKFADPRGET